MVFKYLLLAVFLVLFACTSKFNEAYKPFKKVLAQQAYTAINDSIIAQPKNANFYAERSAIALKNDAEDLAWLDAKNAWFFMPNVGSANAVVNVISTSKYNKEFLPYAKNIVAILPTNTKLRRALQLVYFNNQNYGEALKQNDTIFMQFKNNALPNIEYFLQDRGKLLLEIGDTAKAIFNFEQAIAIAPTNKAAVYELANIYATSGNPKTITLCDAYIKNDVENIEAEPYYFKAVYFSTIKNNNQALTLLQQAITTSYNFIDAWLLKGEIYLNINKLDEAEAAYNKALTISKINGDAWYGLGQIAEIRNDKQNAYLFYGRAASFDIENEEAKAGMERNK